MLAKILLVLLATASTLRADDSPRFGAIRWDAWYGGEKGPVGQTVETSLNAEKWHYRLPFFAQVLGPDQVHIDGTAQATMDREINYAADAGLAYWAFVLYPPPNPMYYGIQNYLASNRRRRLDFTLITSPGDYLASKTLSVVESLVTEKGFLTVLDGRPVIYLGFINEKDFAKSGATTDTLRQRLQDFRAYCLSHQLKNPYIVIMDFTPKTGKKWVDLLGADAITSYTTHGNAALVPGDYLNGSKFEDLSRGVAWFWDQCKATGAQVVPIVVTGGDRRPRVEHPVPWEKNHAQSDKRGSFFHDPAPVQIGEQVTSALQWLKTNQTAAQSQLILCYAWNENDEGGWLVPTLGEGTARLDAVSRAIHAPK